MRDFLVVLVILALSQTVFGDVGPCRYDEDRCSCKLGKANQGTCWDKIAESPGECSRRYCRAGWTCACGGRTHVCYRANKPVNSLKNPADISKSVAECVTKSFPLVAGHELTLGRLKFHFSRKGALADDCNEVAWWHNGELLGNRKPVSITSPSDVDKVLKDREEHTLLELRPGDLIAFRFRDSSYYCYKHLTEFVINGTSVNSEALGFTTHYAREFTKDWFSPSYALTDQNMGEDETEPDIRKFLPLRTTKLSNSVSIVPGSDYWEPRDSNSPDNKPSNWYFRIQVPDVIPKITSI
ncbi:hypothetical protein BWQ96_02149 [Gracilariopsis chorda]|uniref:Uncharacterized protein n=1 Tax=Gracilariopsis chorda TaxID=448386 RepID=A0A2V3J2G8_9FLOR|nr:hypothetical protein BWQ96_02149 [Gracilariopsis chorda]|eukprot:PXF48197.1 hypothetical protein BWQ96_02149 [Gracilariopsis chorda]